MRSVWFCENALLTVCIAAMPTSKLVLQSVAVDDVTERGGAIMDAAQDAAYSIEETLEEAIAERPLASVGLALGLGFLIGVTWRR